MEQEEVEQRIREFIDTNPQYAKNQSFYIASDGTVQVMLESDGIACKMHLPPDAIALARSDNQGNIHIDPVPDIFEKMYILLIGYQIGRITFLEMLTQWEEILGIKST